MTSSNDDTEDLDILQNKLNDELSGKKFLIVFDDVWCDDYILWEALRAPFICGAAGSRILLTSRNENVALAAPSDEIYHPHQLSDEDGWLLFTKYAFRNWYPQTNLDLEEIGRRIVKKCKGLPLALKTIGSLLYRKSSREAWNNILRSEMWNISCNNILPALILSYRYLPSHLKRCFAYCSLFPKDYEFDKQKLVLLWMAQDFLQVSQPNKSIEKIGNECFQELVSRSFFQKSSINETCFVMHDILNDLAIFVSEELCFKQEVKEVQPILEKTRHLSFFTHEWKEFRNFEYLQKNRKLQTFLYLRLWPHSMWASSSLIFNQLCKCKCLRVLTLTSNIEIMEIPDSVRNLIHLRYLDLSNCPIKRLPESICLLYNLQTLKLIDCYRLEELPASLDKLKNLCHLDLQNTWVHKIPANLGELKNLQVHLTSFYVCKGSELNIRELGELNLQGKLAIYELQNVVDGTDAFKPNLREKKCLEELSFYWNENSNEDSHNERDVLEKLQPHQNLKRLSISGYGGTKFPDWFANNTLSNIVCLRLKSCKYCFVMPSLGLLPSLKSLFIERLEGIVTIGAEFLGSNSCTVPFESLETLELAGMVNLEQWDCMPASRAFPRLKSLCVRNCPKLKENLPQQLPSLEDLAIEDCQQLVGLVPWAPTIQRLTLKNCEKMQLEYTPSTLKALCFWGPCTNGRLLEKIKHAMYNNCLEKVEIGDCPNWEFPLKQHHDSPSEIGVERSCGSLGTLTLDLFPALQELTLHGCNNLEMISISNVPISLEILNIKECPNLVSLPECINIFAPSLSSLVIEDCPQMGSFPEGGLPSKLNHLRVMKCPKLITSLMKWGLHNCGFLHSLFLTDDEVVESLSELGLLPSSLISLHIERWKNLRMLDYNALSRLPSLKQLTLWDCPRLQRLPKEGLPTSLYLLHIMGDCPELKLRCQKLKGEDWPKIADIPFLHIF